MAVSAISHKPTFASHSPMFGCNNKVTPDHPLYDQIINADKYDPQRKAGHREVTTQPKGILQRFLTWMIRGYQNDKIFGIPLPIHKQLYPKIKMYCFFALDGKSPSCSQYTLEAIHKYGAIQGCWKGLQRILKCVPDTFKDPELVAKYAEA